MNTALKLYDIAPELEELTSKEEMTDEDIARIDELSHSFEVKADSIAAILGRLETEAAYCKAEEARIATLRKSRESRVSWLKTYLQRSMEAAGIMALDLPTRKITLAKNPPRVVVDDEGELPARFFTIIPESYQLDKKALLEALKDGEIPGAHTEQGLSLRVK